jgi:hypothetical protein
MSIHTAWTMENKNIAVTIQGQSFVVLNKICGIFASVNYEVHYKITVINIISNMRPESYSWRSESYVKF